MPVDHDFILKPVKTIAVSAGKGGVGKSNIAINLAIALGKKGYKVLLLDADLSLANIDVLLNLPVQFNLSHVLQGLLPLKEVILDGPSIRVIPAAAGTDFMTQLSTAEHAGIINAFNDLTEAFDYMIVDTAAGISDTVLNFTSAVQEVIVVICDEPTSLTDAYALIKVMCKRFGWTQFHIVANMVRHMKAGRELFNRIYSVAEQFLDVRLDYLGFIPFDTSIHEAVKKQEAVIELHPNCPAAKAFRQMASVVERWPLKYELGGNTSFFLERLASCTKKGPYQNYTNG